MKRSKWIFAALAVMVCSAQAQTTWQLSKLETPTADSAETNALYGYQVFSNEASKVDVKVQDGAINMVASTIASDGIEGYTANFGLLHPLTPDWAEHDLTGLAKITFQYQNDVTITDVLSVSFGSGAYSDAIAKAGTVFANDIAGATALKGSTTWKEGEVLIEDFSPPSWWTDIPADFPTIGEVLKKAKNLQFAPKTLYSAEGSQAGKPCTKCVTPTMTSVTLKIRNIVLHGDGIGPRLPNELNLGCEDAKPYIPLSDFATSGSKNTMGGDFFTFADTAGVDTDPAKGNTLVTDSIHPAGYLIMDAKLNKRVGGIYHKYAGWAAIGTNFGEGGTLDATGLTGIGFMLADLGTNPDRVQNIAFKVKMKGVADSAIHQVLLPVASIVDAGDAGKLACIRPIDLVQASYVSAAHRVPFDVTQIEQMSWEAKITDDRNPAIDTATVRFALLQVTLHGGIARVGVQTQARTRPTVGYSNGVLRSSGFTGAQRFEIRRLDGTQVASFEATNLLSVRLPRGAYLLIASGPKAYATHKFAVLKP